MPDRDCCRFVSRLRRSTRSPVAARSRIGTLLPRSTVQTFPRTPSWSPLRSWNIAGALFRSTRWRTPLAVFRDVEPDRRQLAHIAATHGGYLARWRRRVRAAIRRPPTASPSRRARSSALGASVCASVHPWGACCGYTQITIAVSASARNASQISIRSLGPRVRLRRKRKPMSRCYSLFLASRGCAPFTTPRGLHGAPDPLCTA